MSNYKRAEDLRRILVKLLLGWLMSEFEDGLSLDEFKEIKPDAKALKPENTW